MNKFLPLLAVGAIIFLMFTCDNTDHADNPMLGKWKSLFAGSGNKRIGFSISFNQNNTFHVEAFGGGQTQPQKISGTYNIRHDTMTIADKLDEPVQVCNYADTGKYTFIQHGDTMLFKIIEDNCESRKLTFEIGIIKSK